MLLSDLLRDFISALCRYRRSRLGTRVLTVQTLPDAIRAVVADVAGNVLVANSRAGRRMA